MILATISKRLLAFAGALALAGCATIPQTSASGPALWRIADEDTTIYLFGTIHALPAGQDWRTPALERAIAEADELVIEMAVDDPQDAAGKIVELGTSPGLPPLSERVPADKRERLAEIVAASGLPPARLDRMESWAAAMTLASVSFRELGLSAGLGVEHGLQGRFKEGSKPIRGLETVEEQLGFFDTLPEHAQRQFLASVLDDPAEARVQFEAMMRAWITGDVDAIARTFDTEFKETPELREALLRRRNANWAQWLDERMDRPGTVLVAVGAGHLAGADSVQQMLRSRGIEAQRVR